MPINKLPEKKNGLSKYRVRVNYTGTDGKYHQIERTVFGLEQAKQMESRLLQDIKHGETVTGSITLQELFNMCIDSKKFEVREATIQKFDRILNNHVLGTLGSYRLNKLTVPVLQKWKDDINQKDLSLKMKKNIFSTFRTLLSYGVKMEFLPNNPLVKVGNFKDANISKAEMDFYTADEFAKFITVAKDKALTSDGYEWNYYVFFNIAFYTGMRKGEIHALRWNDIDGDIVHVTKSITQKLKGGDTETPPKNKSSIRDIELPEPLIKILTEHKQRCEVLPGFSDKWHICGGERPLRDSSIANRNKEYSSVAEIKQIRIHDFRHSHASLLANESINIQEIARRLGHAKIEMTWNTYSHLYPREKERAVKVLNKIVIP